MASRLCTLLLSVLMTASLIAGSETETHSDDVVQRKHSVTIAGKKINYTTHAGTYVLRDDEGAPRASIFFMAYTRDGDFKPEKRPLTFSFNGGPGSSSVWLHLGVLGPRRVLMDDIGQPLPPPYQLVDNPGSILDKTDLVFIDPVTTGYSRPAKDVKATEFHGLEQDIESVGEFIRLFVTRHNRWASPKFMVGESYGTTRAAGLVNHMQNRHGMYFNGVMLISSILSFQTARFDTANDLPYILFLPTYTATAYYHGRLKGTLKENLQNTIEEVKAFAAGEYATALFQGDALPEEQRQHIAEKLAGYTGLSKEFVLASNLRIHIRRFCKELRRDEARTVGRLDSRFTGIDRDAAGESFSYDPSYSAILGPYTAGLMDLVRREMGYETDLTYEILTGKVYPWDYSSHENRYVDVAERLREAMSQNQDLKVFVANGYYDLATPFFATVYTFNHMHLDPKLRSNVSMSYYEAGHMMYIHEGALMKMKGDLDTFIDEALPKHAK